MCVLGHGCAHLVMLTRCLYLGIPGCADDATKICQGIVAKTCARYDKSCTCVNALASMAMHDRALLFNYRHTHAGNICRWIFICVNIALTCMRACT